MAKKIEYKEYPKMVDHPTEKQKVHGVNIPKQVLVANAEAEAALTGVSAQPSGKPPKGGWPKNGE